MSQSQNTQSSVASKPNSAAQATQTAHVDCVTLDIAGDPLKHVPSVLEANHFVLDVPQSAGVEPNSGKRTVGVTKATFEHFRSKCRLLKNQTRRVRDELSLQRNVAIAQYQVATTGAEASRFTRASLLLDRLDHANLIVQHWSFVARGPCSCYNAQTGQFSPAHRADVRRVSSTFPLYCFTILEVHGPTLKMLAARAQRLSFADSVALYSVFKRIGSALIYLHEKMKCAHRRILLDTIATYYPGDVGSMSVAQLRAYPLKLIDLRSIQFVRNARQQYSIATVHSRRKLFGRMSTLQVNQDDNAFLQDSYFFGKMLKVLALGGGSNTQQQQPKLNDRFLALALNDVLKEGIHMMSRRYSITVRAAYDHVKSKSYLK